MDLSRATDVHAEAFGRNPGPGPALAMTCAWLDGPTGFGLWTEVVTLRGRATPVRRVELEEKQAPRLCVNNDAEPEALAEPLRRLVARCGGTVAP